MVVKKVISKKPIELVKPSDKCSEFNNKETDMGLRKEQLFRETSIHEKSAAEWEDKQKSLYE